MNDTEMICDSFKINQNNGTVEFTTAHGIGHGIARIPFNLFSNFIEVFKKFVDDEDEFLKQENNRFINLEYGKVCSVFQFRKFDHDYQVFTTKGGGSKALSVKRSEAQEVICQLECELWELIDEGYIDDPNQSKDTDIVSPTNLD